TMSPSGRYTCPVYGNSLVSAWVLSMHLALVMVAVRPPPLPVAALPCHDHWPSTYMNLPIQYLSPSLIPRVRAALSPNWKLQRGLMPKQAMSGTCAGCAGGAACCLPVGAGPFCPKGLSWATAKAPTHRKNAAMTTQKRADAIIDRPPEGALIVTPHVLLVRSAGFYGQLITDHWQLTCDLSGLVS